MAEKKEYVKLWLSYRSYFEPYSAAEVGRLVLAMMEYRASGVEPEFSGSERFVWPAIKRDLDESLQAQECAAAVNRENGKKGGRPPKEDKPNGFSENPKNPMGFEKSEKSQGLRTKEKDKGQGQGQGQDISAHAREDAVAAVLSDYLNRINPSASNTSRDELRGFAEVMGPDVCRRAFDIALDSKKTSWPYIRAILQDKQRRGVRCLADWDALPDDGRPSNVFGKTKNAQAQAQIGSDEETSKYVRLLAEQRRRKEEP